ncbi:MAG: HTTM domain-containing protein [Deltaproteobacteria bacterium]|nr:HTTM domain-containing protein [Deltaproteobacteria bacterium]
MGSLRRIAVWLGRPIDAASLGAFRMLFGGLMLFEVLHYFDSNRIERYYLEPKLHFPYEFFPFVRPWPGPWMYAHFALMAAGAIGILLGLLYRWSALVFLLTYAWVFLIDKTYYNNHYYLITLMGLLFCLLPADRWASLDARRRGGNEPEVVPWWTVFLLRAQIMIVYVYGGIAKLNPDWLAGEPMRGWLHKRASYPVVGPFFTTEAAAWFFTYGGLFFDLSIGFLLLWRRTRWLAVALIVFFNATNAWMFSIGVFPFLMLATTTLFFEPDWPRRALAALGRLLGRRELAELAEPPPTLPREGAPASGAIVAFLSVYLALQILVPFRHFLYPGEVSWNEDGHRFSWHMKLRDKEGRLRLWATDPTTGKTWEIDYRKDLNVKQRSRVRVLPDMLLQYVGYVKEDLRAGGIESPIIRAEMEVSLNRRRGQPLVDASLDLASVEATLLASSWWVAPFDPDVERLPLDQNPNRIKWRFGKDVRAAAAASH